MLRIFLPAALFILLVFSSFLPYNRGRVPVEIEGYAPVYGRVGDPALSIAAMPVRPTVNGGRIFVIGDLLFQVEPGAGVHIIDYADRQHPVKKGFLNVPGCQEVALKDSVLFTNHYGDMVVLDVRSYPEVKETARMKDVLPEITAGTPPERGVYYECVDRTKGAVIGWERKRVSTANCFNP